MGSGPIIMEIEDYIESLKPKKIEGVLRVEFKIS